MKEYCIVGIDKSTGRVEIIASLKSHTQEHLKEIEDSNCYPAIGETSIAKEAWGKKIDSVLDLFSAPELFPGTRDALDKLGR